MVLGDVHAEWGELNKLITRRKPDVILQCGDFGFWPYWRTFSKLHGKVTHVLGNAKCDLYFCDGNHEDHSRLKVTESPSNRFLIDAHREITLPHIYFMKRGSTLELDGTKYLFVGGGLSIDKHLRTPGVDWFKEEILQEKDIEGIGNTDVVISHTCPTYFPIEKTCFRCKNIMKPIMADVGGKPMLLSYVCDCGYEKEELGKSFDDSRYVLDKVFDIAKPKKWYFGHWHTNLSGTYKDCAWECLNRIDDYDAWRWI